MTDPRPSHVTHLTLRRLRLWRDGVLTVAAFGLVASLVFGTAPTRHSLLEADRLAEVSLLR